MGRGTRCDVVATTLVPIKDGERVKTDRRDGEKLVRCCCAGDRTGACVPDPVHEALPALLRAREAARADLLRARHRLPKILLLRSRRAPDGLWVWTEENLGFIRSHVHFEAFAQLAVSSDYCAELDRIRKRFRRLERAIDDAMSAAPEQVRVVIAIDARELSGLIWASGAKVEKRTAPAPEVGQTERLGRLTATSGRRSG